MALSGAYFWLAIFFLYFESKLSIGDVLRIEAIYYFSVFLLEVPTGYFSDKFGKVRSLRISAALFLISYGLFFSAQGFWTFAIAQVFLAGGIAFQSGTDTAFHYASLVEIDEQTSYGKRESKIGAVLNFTGGLAAFAGGVIGMFALKWAYGLSAFTALGAFLITLFIFREPTSERKGIHFGQQLSDIAGSLANPTLKFLFFASLSMTILIHIPYEYYQIFIAKLISASELSKLTYINATWMNGLHAALAMTIGGFFAAYSTEIKDRFGVKLSVLLSLLIITTIIFLMSSFLTWWVVLIVIFRSAPNAFLAPILNSEIVPRLEAHLRATYLSVQSMAGRFGFALVLIALSFIEENNIELMLLCGGMLGVLLIFINAVFSIPSKFPESEPR